MANQPHPPNRADRHYTGLSLGHGLAGDHGEHLCNHTPDTTRDTQGCPRWPACLGPGPGIGILRPSGPITDDEAAAFAQRWRESMALGRPAELLLRRPEREPWYRRMLRFVQLGAR